MTIAKKGQKNSGKLLFAISEITIKTTRVELSYLDIGDSDYERRSKSS